jgi:hypothetical protein
MPDEPAYVRNLKAFARGSLTPEDLPKLEAELYGASDRASAVMLASILESSLEIFLRSKTRPSLNSEDNRILFDFSGPLGTFSSKIIVGYAFNWYGPDTRRDLDLIRLMRNEFAHSRKSFNFETPQIADVCQQLRSPDWPGAFIPHGFLEAVPDEDLGDAASKEHPRTRYISACHVLSERLLGNSRKAAGPMPVDLL